MIEQYMIWIWLAVFVGTVVVEAMTQDLISIWFTLGGLVGICISNVTVWWAEIIIVSVVSLVALFATRPVVKKIMTGQLRPTNTDEYIGMRLKAVSDITKFDGGVVKINGIEYKAILSENSEDTIMADTIVEVVSLKGNKVIVKEIK